MRFPCFYSCLKLSVGDHTRVMTRAYACTDEYKRAYVRQQTHSNSVTKLRKDKQSCKSFPLILCGVVGVDIGILMWYLCKENGVFNDNEGDDDNFLL